MLLEPAIPTGGLFILGKLFVTGGARLQGTVVSSGSKNSTLAIMAGALLGKGETVLSNIPAIGDVRTMMEMLRALGVKCWEEPQGVVHIDATEIEATEAPYELVKKMRASFWCTRSGFGEKRLRESCNAGRLRYWRKTYRFSRERHSDPGCPR